ncbi:MAG: V-type ATP synthase subunit E family protein [Candidatus Methanomethylophilaceae archaeon]|jgi:V/A-type H+-transporting ATPase subunit E|nr:V-type ATP synthase subunit E family protein [Candidatus Methanomethylophilaceae archaeon]NLF33369.1 hypothetical protein [Thermoplasmatales archaeon]
MALDGVKKEIVASADKSIAAIKAEADAEVQRIVTETDTIISEMKEKEDKKLSEAIERLNRQELSSAELESKKIVLSKKKEILSQAFAETLDALESAPKDKKLEQYKGMIEAAKSVVSEPKAFIPLGDGFTAEQLGVASVEEVAGIKAGLILQSEDGSVEIDLQYRTLLQTVWDREMKNLSDILFG